MRRLYRERERYVRRTYVALETNLGGRHVLEKEADDFFRVERGGEIQRRSSLVVPGGDLLGRHVWEKYSKDLIVVLFDSPMQRRPAAL